MNKIIYLLFFIICKFYFSYSVNYYSLEEIFKILNSFQETEENLNIILESLSESLRKVYAYNEVAKNPPQPEFNKSFFEKINIQERLKNINTKNTTVYQFYRNIKLVLGSLGDYHLGFGGSNNIFSLVHFLEPTSFRIEEYKNEFRMFADIAIGEGGYKYFRNNETIFDIINNNTNIPILSINGKNPFDFVTNFGGVFRKLKSPQASFRFKFLSRNGQTFNEFPLTIEELSNFTIIYDNGDKIVTDYAIYSVIDLNETLFFKENNFLFLNKHEKIDGKIFDMKNFIFFNDMNKNIINNQKYNKFVKKDIHELYDSDKIKWDFNLDYSIGCKADTLKKMNVYFVNNFSPYSEKEYIQVIHNCVELFDSNDYPIILISILNQGGVIEIAQLLIELLSPYTTINIYSAFRNNEIYKGQKIIDEEILSEYYDLEKCEKINYKTLQNLIKKIDYGDDVIDYLSGPVILNGKKYRNELNSLRKKLKNPRKPTDIIIYTDGYSFSAGAMLFKYLQYYGGAISAGYFPNPNLKNIPFDSGSCASTLYSFEVIEEFDIKEYKQLNEFNYSLNVPGTQLFFEPNDLSHPLEYTINPVDEIINIYPTIENLFNLLIPEDYDKFINESFKIFEKYKTQCNPNNKKLVLITNKCDNKFGNKYTHGGYKCGDDGYWTKECIPSYCDLGYIFDFQSNQCIIDICSDIKIKPDSKSHSNSKDTIIIILSVITGLFLIIIVIIVYLLIKQKNARKSIGLNSVDKLELTNNMINK